MREIKFRAWDTTGAFTCFIEQDDSPYMFFQELQNARAEFGSDFILMQYTGLKDKTDKEIYEGDILTGGVEGTTKKDYHVVKWEDLSTWHGMADGHKSKSVGFTFEYYYFTEKGCEVIGNIYENKDLL